MKIQCFNLFIILEILNISLSFTLRIDPRKTDISGLDHKGNVDWINKDYIRRKRYLGLHKKFKLNKRYQECVAPGDVVGHCKHVLYCPAEVFKAINTLDYLCVIARTFVGVCCPDDITSPGVVGSQLVMDLPAGGYDYDESDNLTGCGIPDEGRSVLPSKTGAIQEWPWMAALYRASSYKQGLEQHFCGGAIITDTHILTAAHCLHRLIAKDIKVRLGEYDFSNPNETRARDYDVAEIISHEDFVLATYENDIAILRLAQPTSFNTYIWPICLPPRDENYENEIAIVAGWGQQYFAGPMSEVLLQVAIPIWPKETCINSVVQRITDDNLCAAGYEGGKDSCIGDSGGPLMYQLKNGRWVTLGIVSWGIGCGNRNSPGIYTKVGNYIPWIIKYTMTKHRN